MLCVPPQNTQSQSFVSKWKENTRFPSSQYRSKNSTITAEERVDTEDNNEIKENEEKTIESETARGNGVEETTIAENYAMQDEVEEEEATETQTQEIFESTDDYFGTTEGYAAYTTDAVTVTE